MSVHGWQAIHPGCRALGAVESRCLSRQQPRPLRGVSQPAKLPWPHCRGATLRGRTQPRRRGLGAEHHAKGTRRLERERHRLCPGNRRYARRRQRRRLDAARDQEYVAVESARSRSNGGISKVAAAGAGPDAAEKGNQGRPQVLIEGVDPQSNSVVNAWPISALDHITDSWQTARGVREAIKTGSAVARPTVRRSPDWEGLALIFTFYPLMPSPTFAHSPSLVGWLTNEASHGASGPFIANTHADDSPVRHCGSVRSNRYRVGFLPAATFRGQVDAVPVRSRRDRLVRGNRARCARNCPFSPQP